MEGKDFLIQSRTEGSYDGLLGGKMDKKVTALELDKGGPMSTQQPTLKDHSENTLPKPERVT